MCIRDSGNPVHINLNVRKKLDKVLMGGKFAEQTVVDPVSYTHLVAAQLLRGGVQRTPPQLGAQGAGVLLLAVLEHHLSLIHICCAQAPASRWKQVLLTLLIFIALLALIGGALWQNICRIVEIGRAHV